MRVVVLVGLTLIGSCSTQKWLELDAQGYAEYDQCPNNQPVPLPEGTYADASITLDYERLVPRPDPRVGVDASYTIGVVTHPRRLEQLYHHASGGDPRAALFACGAEAGMRSYGRQAARFMASMQCLVVQCLADFEQLKLSRSTQSGRRLRAMFGQEYEKKALELQLAQQVIGNVLALVMAGKVAMGVRAPPASRPAASRPVARTEARQPASRPAARTETAQQTQSRGGIGPVRAGQAGEPRCGACMISAPRSRSRSMVGSVIRMVSPGRYCRRSRMSNRSTSPSNSEIIWTLPSKMASNFSLYVRHNTHLSGTLRAAIDAEAIILRYIPW